MRTLIIICIFLLAFHPGYSQGVASSLKQVPDLVQALELFQKGQYALAQYKLDGYARLYPQDLQAIEAQFYAALCAAKLNQADADARLKAFMDTYPDHPKVARAYYELGNIQLAKQDFRQGIAYYLLADVNQLDKHTRHSLSYQLAYAYLNEKNFEQALHYFNQVKEQDSPDSYAANYYAGYLAFKSGDYEAALIDLEKAGKNEAYQTVVPYLILEVLYQQKRFQELIAYSERFHALPEPLQNADDIELLTAEAYFFLQAYPAAVKHYETYIGLLSQAPSQEV
ncbi:MAG: tetratricopeptide repeat protein, partial [Burkholderiales bacterium]